MANMASMKSKLQSTPPISLFYHSTVVIKSSNPLTHLQTTQPMKKSERKTVESPDFFPTGLPYSIISSEIKGLNNEIAEIITMILTY